MEASGGPYPEPARPGTPSVSIEPLGGDDDHRKALNQLAELLACEHQLLQQEREARERAERAAADLAVLLAHERKRADQAEARAANAWLAESGRAPETHLRRLRRLTDR